MLESVTLGGAKCILAELLSAPKTLVMRQLQGYGSGNFTGL